MSLITLEAIQAAHVRIRDKILRTPVIRLRGTDVWLKAESLQSTGSFKLRGALNKIASLTTAERACGVVADSSGNHAQAVALAAGIYNIRATIVMPRNAPLIKIEATRYFGAEIIFTDNSTDVLTATAIELANETGMVRIPPFDDAAIIAATGTIGLEILEDLSDVTAITIPISGGGLIAGIATSVKLTRPAVRIIGVEPDVAADAAASLKTGAIVEFSAEQMNKTMADGLRVRRVGTLTWEHIKKYVDEIVTVSEDEIVDAMKAIATHARLVAEPSGAVPVAAWRTGRLSAGGRVAAVLCGGNVDPAQLGSALCGGNVGT